MMIEVHESKRLRSPNLMKKYPKRHMKPKRAAASNAK
jgi:hypothetical protein